MTYSTPLATTGVLRMADPTSTFCSRYLACTFSRTEAAASSQASRAAFRTSASSFPAALAFFSASTAAADPSATSSITSGPSRA